jgi:hypothetical protein
MALADRIRGIRVLRNGRMLFDVGVVSLGTTGHDGASDADTEAYIGRSIRGARATVRILNAPEVALAEENLGDLIHVAPRVGALFQGVLRVLEDSTLLLRSYAAEQGDPFDVSVFEFGVGEGFAGVPGSRALRTLTFASGVGQATIMHSGVRLPILVMSRKLPRSASGDPLEPLELLVREVWERHLGLVRRLKRPTTMELGSSRGARRSPIQTLMLLDYLVFAGGVGEAWDHLSMEPRTTLRITWPVRPVSHARRPILFGSRGPSSIPGSLHAEEEPRRVRDRTATRTTNTAPNRLAVQLAVRIGELAAMISGQLATFGGSAATWQSRARVIRTRADGFRQGSALAEVERNGAVDLGAPALRLDPLYRPIVRAWAMLEEGAALPPKAEALFRDPLKESFELYEYWCWFALCDAVTRHCTEWRVVGAAVGPADAVRAAELPWALKLLGTLNDGRAVAVHYNDPPRGHAPYRSYSIPFRPDLAVLVGTGVEADLCIFDAKYRVDVVANFEAHDEVGDTMKRAERRGMSKHDDLKAMHAYRDALQGVGDARGPRWVIALFPGTEVRLYSSSGAGRFENNIDALRSAAGGIGAIPAAPGKVDVLRAAIDVLLTKMGVLSR